jgi:hypothetical protein
VSIEAAIWLAGIIAVSVAFASLCDDVPFSALGAFMCGYNATRTVPAPTAATDPAGGPNPLKALSSTAENFRVGACRDQEQRMTSREYEAHLAAAKARFERGLAEADAQRVDPDVEVTDIYLIPTQRDPDWTDEDVARRSGVIRNVRMPK